MIFNCDNFDRRKNINQFIVIQTVQLQDYQSKFIFIFQYF